MSKDPAFLFYPNDYIGGTMGMTFEEKGAYMELLMMQFNRGHMTSHMIGQIVGQLWDKLQDKFIQDEKGLWYNERLEREIKKRQAYVKSRCNNLEGINQYSKGRDKKEGHMDGQLTSHMENENEDVNVIDIDYEFILSLYHDLCPEMPKMIKLTDKRKGFVNARYAEYGIEKITTVLRLAGESDFLNGRTSRQFRADFEWLMRPNNFIKVLEGKYVNRTVEKQLAI